MIVDTIGGIGGSGNILSITGSNMAPNKVVNAKKIAIVFRILGLLDEFRSLGGSSGISFKLNLGGELFTFMFKSKSSLLAISSFIFLISTTATARSSSLNSPSFLPAIIR